MKSLKSLTILLLLSASTVIHAEQKPSVHQVDGYFLQQVGNLKVTALFDGELGLLVVIYWVFLLKKPIDFLQKTLFL